MIFMCKGLIQQHPEKDTGTLNKADLNSSADEEGYLLSRLTAGLKPASLIFNPLVSIFIQPIYVVNRFLLGKIESPKWGMIHFLYVIIFFKKGFQADPIPCVMMPN